MGNQLAKLWSLAHQPIPEIAVAFDILLAGAWHALDLTQMAPVALGWKGNREPVRLRAYPADAHFAVLPPAPATAAPPAEEAPASVEDAKKGDNRKGTSLAEEASSADAK